MGSILRLNTKVAFAIFVVVDLVCVGMGMGVPIFCILFGFFVGWYIAKRAAIATANVKDAFSKALVQAIVTSAFTFVAMSAIWGSTIVMLFDPNADFQNFGHPFILYDPKISFIGWLILMILISPFLQLLTTIFGSYLTLLGWLKGNNRGEQANERIAAIRFPWGEKALPEGSERL
jgi:hypothetical protein